MDGVVSLIGLITAQTGDASPVPVLISVLVLIGVLIGATLIVLALRRRLLRKDDASAAPGGMFEELREMHRRGEISGDEYERLRRTIVERVRRGRKPPPAEALPVIGEGGLLTARPGFDLSGEPIPETKGRQTSADAAPFSESDGPVS